MMTRRTVLALLSSAPLAARAAIQGPVVRERRAICSGQFTYLIEPDGTVKVWFLAGLGYGAGAAGLGHNDPMPLFTAFEIPEIRNAVQLASGGSASYAVMPDGRVLAWGINARGDLGNTPLAQLEVTATTAPNANRPIPVLEITDAVRIAAGGNHALAVSRGGAVWAWGYNNYGQLGIGEMPIVRYQTRSASAPIYLPYPMRIPGLTGVAAVAAGVSHSLALMTDGTVRAWGFNRWGLLGDGTVIDRHAPVAVQGVKNAVAVVANDWLSAALLADGTVMTWGIGSAGLGRKTFKQDAPHPTPALVEGVSDVRAIACGSTHVLAVTNAGTLTSWGASLVGEVGHEGAMPARVPGLAAVRSVAADTPRSLAILADGTIMVWGRVPLHARVDGRAPDVSHTPIPLVIKGLKNP